jgi:hypothetical protein
MTQNFYQLGATIFVARRRNDQGQCFVFWKIIKKVVYSRNMLS